MEKYTLSKNKFPELIKKIRDKYSVIAPVKNNDIFLFQTIEDPNEINLDYLNSQVPPKEMMFHQTETMFSFTPGTSAKIEPIAQIDENRIIFGIRPCDAKSFHILNPVFDSDFKDPYYLTNRKNSILIGLSCNKPGVNCFCTSLDDGPCSTEHVDMLLTDIGEKYFLEIQTDKGKDLTKNIDKLLIKATEQDIKKKKEAEKKAIDLITRKSNNKDIVDKLDKIFDHSYWKNISLKCIGCRTCTYLCPTCHCFDIQDETSMTKGKRIRVWDSCMNPEYTLHASGYNPRPSRMNRTRNRVYHKYNYYPKNHNIIACVGCGRCVDNCPVNIDIIDMINTVQEIKI